MLFSESSEKKSDDGHFETNVREIRKQVRFLIRVHIAIATVSMILTLMLVVMAIRYYPSLSGPLSGDSIAGAVYNVYDVLGNVKNITGDVAFVSGGMRELMVPQTQPGRHLLQQGLPMNAELEAAATGLLKTMASKAEEMDASAFTDFLRYVMEMPWKADIAPRFDQTLESVQRAELIGGVMIRALATSAADTNLLDDKF